MIEPRQIPQKDFPESTAATPGMTPLRSRSAPTCTYLPDVEYIRRGGRPLHLQVILPCADDPDVRFPLVVFIPGSAWHKQNVHAGVVMAGGLALRGFAVAMVEYRPSEESPFPAQILDAKMAVRFLKRNAARFRIDPDRVAVMGDSSGGHTALMTAFTTGLAELEEQGAEDACSSGVRGVVDFYGPTDISRMNEELSTVDHRAPDSPEGYLIGRENVLEHPELVAPTVVMNYVSRERDLPPALIFHGSKDPLVNFSQSVLLYAALRDAGKDAAFYQVLGAGHGGGEFWSDDVMDIVERFLRRVLAGREPTA